MVLRSERIKVRYGALSLLLFLGSFSALANEIEPKDHTGKERAFPYEIKIPNGEKNAKPKVLFIKSYFAGEYSDFVLNKVDVFRDIISSHWRMEIEEIETQEYKESLIGEYDVVFFIKEDWEAVSDVLIKDLVSAENKKIVLVGFNNELVGKLLKSNLKKEEIPISNFSYKNVAFEDESLVLTMDTSQIKNLDSENINIFFEGARAKEENAADEGFSLAFSTENAKFTKEGSSSSFFVFPFVIPDYYSIEDHTIVFLDLLYEVFGSGGENESFKKTALLRLEDVNVFTYYVPNSLAKVYDFLKKSNIPFHIAFIVKYVDPPKNIELNVGDGRRFGHLLRKMVGEGLGVLVQHGYTHQIEGTVSGVGFEFWDKKRNAPLMYDSEDFVKDRIQKAKESMISAGLPVPDIWETPHYALSQLDDQVINSIYPLRYESHPKIGSLPFIVKIKGNIYIPENLGFISEEKDEFNNGQPIQDFEKQIKYLNVFRNPTASFFWHPWRDVEEIKYLVGLFQKNGYVFSSVYDLVEKEEETSGVFASLEDYRSNYSPSVSYNAINYLILFVYLFFVLGCFFFIYTILRIKKYVKVIDKFDLSINELEKKFKKRKKKFPFFVIFVPARNEGYVIENTIRKLAKIDYPKKFYKIFIIVDERELDDDVEILTKSVVRRVGKKLNKRFGTSFVNCLEIPKWYSGTYGETKRSFGKSTKGRALNFALQKLEKRKCWRSVEMIGVLDADGRLNKNILKEVAFKKIFDGSNVLQGPVFQVSNFEEVSMTGIAAGIELAIHHLTELPSNLLKKGKMQFLAGTNYFIDKNIISDVGGWNQHALVEDAELALRIYIQRGVVADWLGSPEIEQTPPSFSVYRRQRERWVRGHLELIRTIYEAKIPLGIKLLFFWKIFTAQFRFIFDLGIPLIAIVLLFSGFFVDLGRLAEYLSLILFIFAFFMWDLYGRLFRKLSFYVDSKMNIWHKFMMSLKLFLFYPIFIFIQSIPRIQALFNYLSSAPVSWYKTERTKEKPYV